MTRTDAASADGAPAAQSAVKAAAVPWRDPYAALDDLMCVIEALCPVWPPRPTGGELKVLLL